MPKPCHGSEAEFHSHYCDLHSSVLEVLGRIQRDIKNADTDIETAEGTI